MQTRTLVGTLKIGSLVFLLVLLTSGKSLADQPPFSEAGLGFFNPLNPGGTGRKTPAGPTDTFSRQHTYLFFVNGVDPLNLANFYGLYEYVKGQGFPNAYFSQMTQGRQCFEKARILYRQDPHARLVLVGFSGGAYVVRRVANDLQAENIPVHLLAYLAGDMIRNTPYSQPKNAWHILNVTAHGFCLTGGDLFCCGEDLDRAVNLRLPVRHFQLPSQAQTIQALMGELAKVTAVPK